MRVRAYILAIVAFAVVGCDKQSSSVQQLDQDIASTPVETMETVALFALGDSLTAGTQDAATLDATQQVSWLSVLAAQAASSTNVHYVYPALNEYGSRMDAKAIPTNIAVPGLELHEALDSTGTISLIEGIPIYMPSFLRPLGDDGASITPLDALLESLVHEDHSAMSRWAFIWIGNNDIFFDFTDVDTVTPEVMDVYTPTPDAFRAQLFSLIEAVRNSGPEQLFVLTIPNVLLSGFLLTPDDLGFLLSSDAPKNVLQPDALIPLHVALELFATLSFGSPIDDQIAMLQQNIILDAREQQLILDRIDAYNDIVRKGSDEIGYTLIDVAASLNQLLQDGVDLGDGRRLTRSWSRGGVFSLDGVHPSHTGHALIANIVIDELNAIVDAAIPRVDIPSVHAADPYRDGDGDGRVAGPSWEAAQGSPASLLRIFVDDDDSTR